MKMAARELLRRPRSFVVPAGILLLLALLLLYPSAVLDGLNRVTTGALRNAPADLIVYSDDAKSSLLRSRIEPAVRAQVAAVDGVDESAAFDATLLSGTVEGRAEPVGLAVLAAGLPFGDELPAPGEALVATSLRDQGIAEGDQVLVGPFRVPVTVTGFVSDVNLLFQSGMVVDKSTWLATVGQAPGATSTWEPVDDDGPGDAPGPAEAEAAASPASGSPSQTLLVNVAADADPTEVAAAVDEATGGITRTVTKSQAVAALPGRAQQATTFGYIRGVTLVVALVVVGLFLSFVTLERAPLYAVLKAIGMSSRQLFSGVVVQVLLMTVTAVAAATLVTWGLTHLPLDLPTTMRPSRLVETLAALALTSVVGSVLSLRRVVRIDPASAIG